MVSRVFIAEFQLMLRHEQEQRVDRVRDRRAQALRITVCSMPCTASG